MNIFEATSIERGLKIYNNFLAWLMMDHKALSF